MSTVKYKVYELTDGGTLRIPFGVEYGHRTHIYDAMGYATLEEAEHAVAEQDGSNMLIIAVANPSWGWPA